MNLSGLVNNSLVNRLLTGFLNTAAGYCRESLTCRYAGAVPDCFSAGAGGSALLPRAAGKAVLILLQPLVLLGAALGRAWPESRIVRTGLPGCLSESLLYRTVSGLRVESMLWLVVFYPVVDYLLRTLPGTGALSSLWDELLLFFLLAAWPVQMAFRGRITYRCTPLDIPLVIYAGITLFLFFLRSKDTSLAAEGLRVYLEYMVWFFIGSNLLQNRRQADSLIRGMVAAAAVVASVGIAQYALGVEMPSGWVDEAEGASFNRVFSIVISPNVLGSLLLLFTPLTIGLAVTARGVPRLVYSAAGAAILACIVFTGSRGAWLALAGALAVYCLMHRPALVVLLAAGSALAVKLVPNIGLRLGYMFSSAYMASSMRAGRLARWEMALEKMAYDPWLGSGFGTYGGAVAARRLTGIKYVDNFYLKTAVESGVIGLLAFLWLIASAIRACYAAVKNTPLEYRLIASGLLAGLIGVALHNFVENIFEVPMMSTYFWFVTGLLMALPRVIRE